MASAGNKRRADGEQEAAEVGDAAVAAAAFVDAASAPGTGTATALSNGNLTNYQRKIICEFYRKSGGVMSQKDLAQWTKHEFGLKKTPAQSTISGILRRQHEFVNMSSQELGIKKRRVVQHPQLDSALANWVIQCAHRGITVQGDLTKEKAKHFAKMLGIPESDQPEFSNGWLHSFQLRHNFSFRKFNADQHHQSNAATATGLETAATSTNATDGNNNSNGNSNNSVTRRSSTNTQKVLYFSGLNELLSETDKYEPKNIFALEETAVLYTLPPTQSAIVEDPMRGKKRVVVSLAANAEGSEKLQPLFISHHEHPKCFRKKSAEQHGLHYFWNNKAWMTGVIFSRWLQRLDFAMANQKRRILLFINEVPSHVVTHLELTNVVVFILPNGASQMLNPITSRVVTMFKKRFRRYHLRHAIDKVDSPKGAMFDVDVLQAMKWASTSWDEITTETIKRAWIPTNLLRERMGLEEHDLLQEEEEVLLDTELEHLMLFLRLTDPVPIMEYLNDEAMSENTVHEEFFDIVDNVCDVPEDEVDESVEETPGRNLSLQEKLKAFRDVLHVLKERSDADDSALNALRRVQDAIRMEGQKEALGSLNTSGDAKNSLDLSESVATATSSAMSSLEVDGQQHMDAAALLESSESSALSAASASLAESTGDHTDAMLGSATDGVARQSGNDDFHAVI
ncbi:hypothetical protein BBJ29_009154 [Phytophthora kernoviae]|uniref:HTH CENPB-type domain-containing protein n=1 Tax=Phytophthora kernoviae TaxID=325452 RepID=A0A3F2RRC4_9STRA|nr:hypothetical protein BBJ29_009154 [Phytophthora kernoviae]RLN62719.1 hypothetical protein BBP00_00004583 [Phytophthora kernoviae]